jgi:hypothetical protein
MNNWILIILLGILNLTLCWIVHEQKEQLRLYEHKSCLEVTQDTDFLLWLKNEGVLK